MGCICLQDTSLVVTPHSSTAPHHLGNGMAKLLGLSRNSRFITIHSISSSTSNSLHSDLFRKDPHRNPQMSILIHMTHPSTTATLPQSKTNCSTDHYLCPCLQWERGRRREGYRKFKGMRECRERNRKSSTASK